MTRQCNSIISVGFLSFGRILIALDPAAGEVRLLDAWRPPFCKLQANLDPSRIGSRWRECGVGVWNRDSKINPRGSRKALVIQTGRVMIGLWCTEGSKEEVKEERGSLAVDRMLYPEEVDLANNSRSQRGSRKIRGNTLTAYHTGKPAPHRMAASSQRGSQSQPCQPHLDPHYLTLHAWASLATTFQHRSRCYPESVRLKSRSSDTPCLEGQRKLSPCSTVRRPPPSMAKPVTLGVLCCSFWPKSLLTAPVRRRW